MLPERTFYACRALRRLLLGMRYCPIDSENSCLKNYCLIGHPFSGRGLIIKNSDYYVDHISTDSYIPVFQTLELTDWGLLSRSSWESAQNRALYSPLLLQNYPDYQIFFGILMRFLTLAEFEDCVSSFILTLSQNKSLWLTCKKNYLKLHAHMRTHKLTYCPIQSVDRRLEFLRFGVKSFLTDSIHSSKFRSFRNLVLGNCLKYPEQLLKLGAMIGADEITIKNKKLLSYQSSINAFIPNLCVPILKKKPSPQKHRVITIVEESHFIHPCSLPETTQYWLDYADAFPPIYRLVMVVSVFPVFTDHRPGDGGASFEYHPPTTIKPSPSARLVSLMNRTKYAPKDPYLINSSEYFLKLLTDFSYRAAWTNNDDNYNSSSGGVNPQKCPTYELQGHDLLSMYNPRKNVSLDGFKITIFNTNMVINTRISTSFTDDGRARPESGARPPRYFSILDIPKITNNFVVKKFSMKEPSFTISIFYSDDMRSGAAININICGDLMLFLFAACALKCFLPIRHVSLANVSNWNSTYDLHGLENQELVRQGRKDLFWTTNFPSAVSSRDGFNISWFKAATATVSKIYGDKLVSQVKEETLPILNNSAAQLNYIKNGLFTSLEKRNYTQIQTLHKRFLESLFECTSFLGLNCRSIKKLGDSGAFDYSKRIISHSKNKHECALVGYRKCNLIPKILTDNKKVRLDELGRNANFITFMSRSKSNFPSANRKRVFKHVIRRLAQRPRSYFKQ